MLSACRACSGPDVELVHESVLDRTLTSESKLRPGRLRIHLCHNCAHVMSDDGGLGDVAAFYREEYDSLLESPEADDLYDLDANLQPIYRSQIQLENLIRLANLPARGDILDFGCGKGGFLARFAHSYPAWKLHGADVSERYRASVESITGPGGFSVADFNAVAPLGGPFDLITMFFVGEHLERPIETLGQVAGMLTPDGLLYLTVPNVLVNSIDAFLADHLSHFSALSLSVLLHRCGLRPVMLSEHHQMGQITVMAAPEPAFKGFSGNRVANDIVALYAQRIRGLIESWVDCADRVREFLASRPVDRGELAVYGAGVFGSYLALNSGSAAKDIACFLDQNPFKVGKQHMGKPIVHPRDLPEAVSDMLVGLNPGRARGILEQAGLLGRQNLRFFFP
jgi:SAM-dependent methyltransferase